MLQTALGQVWSSDTLVLLRKSDVTVASAAEKLKKKYFLYSRYILRI